MRLQNMKASETTEQIKLFQWAKSNEQFIPELKLIYHVPNEGKRKQSTGEILKAAGLRAGVPDVCLPVPRRGYAGLYIEMKYGKNKPTKDQTDYMDGLRNENNYVQVAYSADAAREIIRHYLARSDGFDLVNCEEAPKIFSMCEGVAAEGSPCHDCKYNIKNQSTRKGGEHERITKD